MYEEVVERLKKAYGQLKIGDPLEAGTLYGPLHTENSVQLYLNAVDRIKKQNGQIVYGGKVRDQANISIIFKDLFTAFFSALIEKATLLNRQLSQALSMIQILYIVRHLLPFCTFSSAR